LLPGPMARETLTLLLNLDVPVEWIYGNGEVAVLERMAGSESAKVPEQYRPAIAWTAEQVRDHEQLIRAWPMTVRLEIDGLGSALFCHATPRNEDEAFTRLTPEDRLLPVFDGVDAAVVVCGHTHMQFDRTIGRTRVVNAGSVGMPFGEPGADWLLLGPEIQFQKTLYDFRKGRQPHSFDGLSAGGGLCGAQCSSAALGGADVGNIFPRRIEIKLPPRDVSFPAV